MPNDAYYRDPRVAEAYDAAPELPLDDVPFYVDLALEAAAAGQRVLELACGTGRVTIPIARAGVDVLGIDNAAAMLDVARRNSAGLPNLRWVEADMRDFRIEARFGLVVIPYRSFLLLLTDAGQRACLASVHDHLVEGGRLALSFFNPAPLLALRRPNASPDRANGGEPARPVIARVAKGLRMRYVGRDEMQRLLADAGFAVEALYGGFDQRPFAADSAEMVWLARKR